VQLKLEGAVTAGLSKVMVPTCNMNDDNTLRSFDQRTGQNQLAMLYTSDAPSVEVTVVENVDEACRFAFKRRLAGKGLDSQGTTLSSYVLWLGQDGVVDHQAV
jgi:predicted ATP-dependent protease